jgi:hypothetical protein
MVFHQLRFTGNIRMYLLDDLPVGLSDHRHIIRFMNTQNVII